MSRTSEELLAIGEVSRRTGAAVSAIRYYESLGLVTAHRTAGGTRRFPRHTIRRISIIQLATRFGIPLVEVAEVFSALPAERPPTRRDWMRISRAWHERLEERKQAIDRMQRELAGCIGCGCLSLQACTLFNPGDRLGEDGTGARRVDPGAR